MLPQAAVEWDAAYVEIGLRLSQLEQARDNVKHHLQNAIGEAEVGVLPDGAGHYSWKTQARKERVLPAWTGRVFRRHSSRDKENGI